eukprot:g2072.t1
MIYSIPIFASAIMTVGASYPWTVDKTEICNYGDQCAGGLQGASCTGNKYPNMGHVGTCIISETRMNEAAYTPYPINTCKCEFDHKKSSNKRIYASRDNVYNFQMDLFRPEDVPIWSWPFHSPYEVRFENEFNLFRSKLPSHSPKKFNDDLSFMNSPAWKQSSKIDVLEKIFKEKKHEYSQLSKKHPLNDVRFQPEILDKMHTIDKEIGTLHLMIKEKSFTRSMTLKELNFRSWMHSLGDSVKQDFEDIMTNPEKPENKEIAKALIKPLGAKVILATHHLKDTLWRRAAEIVEKWFVEQDDESSSMLRSGTGRYRPKHMLFSKEEWNQLTDRKSSYQLAMDEYLKTRNVVCGDEDNIITGATFSRGVTRRKYESESEIESESESEIEGEETYKNTDDFRGRVKEALKTENDIGQLLMNGLHSHKPSNKFMVLDLVRAFIESIYEEPKWIHRIVEWGTTCKLSRGGIKG